jgi:hypothetical protein
LVDEKQIRGCAISDKTHSGQRYWSLIEPIWLQLNDRWDNGPDAFLCKFRDMPAAVGHLYAAPWCQSEVCNGGLYQFFYNTTGILAPEAVAGFNAIGINEWAGIVSEGMRFFSIPYPRDRVERQKQLPASTGTRRAEWDPFAQLDGRFYAWLRGETCRWEKLADAYGTIAQH